MIPLILDTDIGSDCDDAGAMAVLHALADLGEVDILALTHATGLPAGPGSIAVIDAYYGRPDIPIGACRDAGFLSDAGMDQYATRLIDAYADRYGVVCRTRAQAEDAVALLRRTLTQEEDGSVTVVAIGQLRNLRHLLESGPDAISPLDGTALVAKKVRELCLMGGYFPRAGQVIHIGGKVHEAEYNIETDIPSAQAVLDLWPTPVTLCGFELGFEVRTGGPLVATGDTSNPVLSAYARMPGGLRESWDPLTVLYAVRGESAGFRRETGRVSVDDRGVTTLAPDPAGPHARLVETVSWAALQQTLDALLLMPPAAGPAGRP